MAKVKKDEGYDIYEHVHRLSAWCAGSAILQAVNRREGKKLNVEYCQRIIVAAKLKDKLYRPKSLPNNPVDMDILHKKWRNSVRAAAKRRGYIFSHGVAAKLINVYFKVGLVTIANINNREIAKRIATFHPPIDGELLSKLVEVDTERTLYWRKKERDGWSNLKTDEYQDVINEIRKFLAPDKRLWMVEIYWPGYRVCDKRK
jgi:hypothetical protein